MCSPWMFSSTSASPYPDRDSIFDRRVRMLAAQIAGRDAYEFGPTEDHRMLLPWQGGDPLRRTTWIGGLPALTTRR